MMENLETAHAAGPTDGWAPWHSFWEGEIASPLNSGQSQSCPRKLPG